MLNVLQQWASEHKIPKNALVDLHGRLGVLCCTSHDDINDESETSFQNRIRLEEARRGVRLFRNNSGVAYDRGGRPVRFGLANDSAKSNEVVKSSDLIGIDQEGRFTSLEIKRPGWTYRGTAKEAAQLNWIVFVNSMGGRAKFVSSLIDYE